MKTAEKVSIEPFKQGYKLDGKYVPRVTTILSAAFAKPGLLVWARREALKLARKELESFVGQSIQMTPQFLDELIAKCDREPDRQKDEAADIGTRAHQAINEIILGKEPKIDSDILPCVQGFLDWQKSTDIKLTAGELRVGSLAYGYAGTLDGIGSRGGDLILVDFKTSNSIRPQEYSAQVGAYVRAYEEIHHRGIAEGWILRFSKTEPQAGQPAFEARKIRDLGMAFRLFLNAKDIYDSAKYDWFV